MLLNRFVEVLQENARDLTLRCKIQLTAEDATNCVEISGAVVISESAGNKTDLLLNTDSQESSVAFNKIRTPKLEKGYPAGINSNRARLENFKVLQGSGQYAFSLSDGHADSKSTIVTIYDRKFLKNSSDLDALRIDLKKMNCQSDNVDRDISAVKNRMAKLSDADKCSEVYWECELLLRGLQLFRQWATQGMISELQAYYESVGKTEAFQAFIADFQNIISPHALTNHGFRDTFETLNEEDVIWSYLSKVFGILSAAGYQVFLSSGTLLGAIREGRLIKFDDDIDLCIMLHSSKIDDVIDEWMQLKAILEANNLLEQERMGMYKLPRIMNFEIDLFPAWCSEGDTYIFPYCYGKLPQHDILPLKPWGDQELLVPNNPAAILTENYGDNWQVPDPYFRFDWKQARRAFRPFLVPLRSKVNLSN